MSRYVVDGIDPGTRVAYGWDHPLLTFYVQVYQDGHEGPVIWRGGSLRELYDLDDLKRAIRPHARLSLAEVAQLYGDREEGR